MTKITFTKQVLPLFTLSLAVATVGSFIGMQYLSFIASIAPILYIIEFVLIFAAFFARRQKQVGGLLLYGFVFVTGLVLAPVIAIYVVSYGPAIIFQALLLTTLVFGGLSGYAYVSGQDFSRLGGFLFIGLIGLIITSLVNIFLRNGTIFFIVDIASILIFSGYVLYDMGRILNQFDDSDVYTAVMSLYIDFLNLFLNILELLGIFERRRD